MVDDFIFYGNIAVCGEGCGKFICDVYEIKFKIFKFILSLKKVILLGKTTVKKSAILSRKFEREF